MIIETMKDGTYQSFNDDKLLLTITALENNIYRAVNMSFDITAKIVPLDDYRTKLECIEYKKADKNGRYRKTTKLLNHTLKWLDYILEEKGFIPKKKCIK